MQFFCQHCGHLLKMLDDGSIGCPEGCKDPIKDFQGVSQAAKASGLHLDIGSSNLPLPTRVRERRISNFWKWLMHNLEIGGFTERRKGERRKKDRKKDSEST